MSRFWALAILVLMITSVLAPVSIGYAKSGNNITYGACLSWGDSVYCPGLVHIKNAGQKVALNINIVNSSNNPITYTASWDDSKIAIRGTSSVTVDSNKVGTLTLIVDTIYKGNYKTYIHISNDATLTNGSVVISEEANIVVLIETNKK